MQQLNESIISSSSSSLESESIDSHMKHNEENARILLEKHLKQHKQLQQALWDLATFVRRDFIEFWYRPMLQSAPLPILVDKQSCDYNFLSSLQFSLIQTFLNIHNTLESMLIRICYNNLRVDLRRREVDVEVSNLLTFGIANVFIVHLVSEYL